VASAVVGEAEERARAEGHGLGLGDQRRGDGFGEVFTVGHALQVALQILDTQVERAFVEGDTFDEGELAVRELQAQLRQGFEAAGFSKICGDQVAVVEVEHAVRRALGQFQAARVAQLADELHDRGQADAVE
jgi:hypothetical protein